MAAIPLCLKVSVGLLLALTGFSPGGQASYVVHEVYVEGPPSVSCEIVDGSIFCQVICTGATCDYACTWGDGNGRAPYDINYEQQAAGIDPMFYSHEKGEYGPYWGVGLSYECPEN